MADPSAPRWSAVARPLASARSLRLVLGLVLLVLLSLVSLLLHPARTNGENVTTTSVRSLACPSLNAPATLVAGSSTAPFGVTSLGGTPSSVSGLVQRDAAKKSWLLQPSGADQPVGGILARGSQWAWAACAAASANSYVNVPDLSTADLLLVNPDPVSVAVNLTFYTSKGVRSVAGARGLVVQPQSSRVVPLSVVAGSGAAGIGVSTDSGRVLALARPITSSSFGAQSAQAPQLVTSIPAVPKGAAKVRVMVTNPGTRDATASVAGLTRTGRINLAGAQQVTVPAQQTVSLDISKPVSGDEMGLEVSSDQPLVASAQVGDKSGLQLSAAPVLPQLNAVVPTDASLYVLNPGTASATVEVSLTSGSGNPAVTSRVIPPGALAVISLEKQTVLHLSSSRPVSAAVGMLSNNKVAVMAAASEASSTGSISLAINPSLH